MKKKQWLPVKEQWILQKRNVTGAFSFHIFRTLGAEAKDYCERRCPDKPCKHGPMQKRGEKRLQTLNDSAHNRGKK